MLVEGSWRVCCSIACTWHDFGHNVLCSASVLSFANEQNNSYISLSQKISSRISYGDAMCFTHMWVVLLSHRKEKLRHRGAAECPQPLQSALSAAGHGAWDGRKS